ncbi:MAG: M18 family aminopeptidase [Spirochaetales bacterium]|nr:MAG: M18 family aminopeptidase [Spirochaetales bacterium]
MRTTPESIPGHSIALGMLDYLAKSPTPYHATHAVAALLEETGFTALSAVDHWEVVPGGAYFLKLGDGALLAVKVGQAPLAETGAVVLAGHTDSPALRVKERGTSWRKGYLCLPTEVYGAPIIATWMDRTLGLAGRAVTRDGETLLFRLPHAVTIPNVALHLNRKINEGFEYNLQDHLVALMATPGERPDGNAEPELRAMIAESSGCGPDDILEDEVLLHDAAPGVLLGSDESLVVASRIDNLAACFANTRAFLESETNGSCILALYNHEEVGSVSAEGAQSDALTTLVRRLVVAQGGSWEDTAIALGRSTFVSNDAAHGLHPSFSEKHDPAYAPVLGGGPVLKANGMYKYATTAATGAAFGAACAAAGVPMQRQVNRSDMRSGGTVGAISWANTGMSAVDVGIAILGMHSIQETAGSLDTAMMIRALVAFIEERGEK